MIAGVRLRDRRKFAAGLPVELARVDDDAAEGRAVSADKLGGGMEHDVRAVLDGPDQIGRAEGVVDGEGNAVPVGDACKGSHSPEPVIMSYQMFDTVFHGHHLWENIKSGEPIGSPGQRKAFSEG